MNIENLRRLYNTACEAVQRAAEAIESADKSADLEALRTQADEAILEAERTKANLEQAERQGSAVARFTPVSGSNVDAEATELAPDQSLVDWVAQRSAQGLLREHFTEPGQKPSLGKFLRGMATGRWKDAEIELRAFSEGTVAAGGAMVPTILAAELIDKARARSVCLQAGVRVVPLESDKVDYARITGDAASGWKAENAAITDSDFVLDKVSFDAQSLVVTIKCSQEALEDAIGLEDAISNAFSQILALKLDLAILRGAGAASEPKGILNQVGIGAVTNGVNGAALTNYAKYIDQVFEVRKQNFEPNAVIVHPRTEQSRGKLVDSQLNPLKVPDDFAGLAKLTSTQIPINLTVGTSVDCSEAYMGQWDQGLLGMRTDLQFRVLDQPLMGSNLQVIFLAYLRADFQLAHPEAFAVQTGIRP